MSDALKRAEHYRNLARRYLRLPASTESPNHYLRIAVQYNALAESEELSTSHGDGDQHFDRFDLMDGVLAFSTSEESCVFASPRPLAPMVLSPKRVERMLERLGQEPFLPIGNRGELR